MNYKAELARQSNMEMGYTKKISAYFAGKDDTDDCNIQKTTV